MPSLPPVPWRLCFTQACCRRQSSARSARRQWLQLSPRHTSACSPMYRYRATFPLSSPSPRTIGPGAARIRLRYQEVRRPCSAVLCHPPPKTSDSDKVQHHSQTPCHLLHPRILILTSSSSLSGFSLLCSLLCPESPPSCLYPVGAPGR